MRLRDLREDHDLTQSALAEVLHVRQNTYSQYENGQRQLPVEVLVQLAEYYHTYGSWTPALNRYRTGDPGIDVGYAALIYSRVSWFQSVYYE